MTPSLDEEAVQVDTYLDELLASRMDHRPDADASAADVAHAAGVVRAALVRFHPSFRFEEALADRLRAAAAGIAPGTVAGSATVIRFPARGGAALTSARAAATAGDGSLALATTEPALPVAGSPVERGWVLVGGAIASGVSLAAGVLLARRRSRGESRWERLA